MSNLGGYKTMTKLAKRVGGPGNLLLITLAGGYIVCKPIELVCKRLYQKIKNNKEKDKDKTLIYEVNDYYEGEDGCILRPKDKLALLEKVSENYWLIEKIGDEHSPYIVPLEDFKRITMNIELVDI